MTKNFTANRELAQALLETSRDLQARARDFLAKETMPMGFLLVTKDCRMVVGQMDDMFRLLAPGPNVGHVFGFASDAIRAKNRWNANLNAEQRAADCEVSMVNRKTYVERVLQNAIEMEDTLTKALALLPKEE